MTASKLNRYWTLTIILLLAIIVIGGIVIWSRYCPGQPIEISMSPGQALQGRIYIGGAVTNAGFYPFTSKDNIEALIQSAGGTTDSANLNELKLYIPKVGEGQEPQKIDINRAEVWLLEALPGIGEILAQRIVAYRQRNVRFANTEELLKVADIGTKTYEQIKGLITVADE